MEKLGGMTPEDLEAIPGIGAQVVEKIQVAVNAYYSQFEPSEVVDVAEMSLQELEQVPAAETSEPELEQQASNKGDAGVRTSGAETEFDTIEDSEEVR